MEINSAYAHMRSLLFWAEDLLVDWRAKVVPMLVFSDAGALKVGVDINNAAFLTLSGGKGDPSVDSVWVNAQLCMSAVETLKKLFKSKAKTDIQFSLSPAGLSVTALPFSVSVPPLDFMPPFSPRWEKVKEAKQSIESWVAVDAKVFATTLARIIGTEGAFYLSADKKNLLIACAAECGMNMASIGLNEGVKVELEARLPRKLLISAMNLCAYSRSVLIGASETHAVFEVGSCCFFVDYASSHLSDDHSEVV